MKPVIPRQGAQRTSTSPRATDARDNLSPHPDRSEAELIQKVSPSTIRVTSPVTYPPARPGRRPERAEESACRTPRPSPSRRDRRSGRLGPRELSEDAAPDHCLGTSIRQSRTSAPSVDQVVPCSGIHTAQQRFPFLNDAYHTGKVLPAVVGKNGLNRECSSSLDPRFVKCHHQPLGLAHRRTVPLPSTPNPRNHQCTLHTTIGPIRRQKTEGKNEARTE